MGVTVYLVIILVLLVVMVHPVLPVLMEHSNYLAHNYAIKPVLMDVIFAKMELLVNNVILLDSPIKLQPILPVPVLALLLTMKILHLLELVTNV